MKLWVDDLRKAPNGWIWVDTSQVAISLLSAGLVQEISLDHDLGGHDTTRPVVAWMIENDVWPRLVRVHTSNPVGRAWLVGTVRSYAPDSTKVVVTIM